MRITLNSFGSRGDVQPFIALGLGLQAAGHDVRLFTHEIFESFVTQHGLAFFPLAIDPREVLVATAAAEMGSNWRKLLGWMRDHFRQGMPLIFESTLAAAQGADLLINSSLSFAGYHVAQKLSLPAIAAYPQPVTPTRAFSASGMRQPPDWMPLKGAANYLSAKLMNQSFLGLVRPIANESRQAILGMAPLPARYYWKLDSPANPLPFLYAYSPAVLPKPADWGSSQHVTGYWFLGQEESYTPPAALAHFLASGPPPIYIGFGSMVDHEGEAFTRMVVEAAAASGQRVILLGGWSRLGGGELPPEIFSVDDVPHDWLFPRTAGVIHHGGAGTTAAGLRAGVPTQVIPFFTDQFFWGYLVHHIGAGPAAIPRPKLTAGRLAAAISELATSPSYQRRAAALGSQIRAEDGVAQAVALIEHYMDPAERHKIVM